MTIIDKTLNVNTTKRNQMIDITASIAEVIAESKVDNGQVVVFCPHTTAAITINENADPDVVHDILMTLEEILPQRRSGYRHSEGNSDAHIKSSMFGVSETIIVRSGQMQLGTWQGIYFCEFDGPRNRKVNVSVMSFLSRCD